MSEAKKITLYVPAWLLKQAQKTTKSGITETIKQGLKLLAAEDGYKDLLNLRGKVKFSINLKDLRKDRL